MTDDQKQWVLDLKDGEKLYTEVFNLLNNKKITKSLMIEMVSFWLNQRSIRHDTPLNYSKSTKRFIKNEGEPKLFWEKYDSSISVQTLKNEFQVAWNRQGRNLIQSVNKIFN